MNGLEHIDIDNDYCQGCGAKTNFVPIIMKDYCGYKAEVCKCGHDAGTTIVIPRSERAKEFWDKIL